MTEHWIKMQKSALKASGRFTTKDYLSNKEYHAKQNYQARVNYLHIARPRTSKEYAPSNSYEKLTDYTSNIDPSKTMTYSTRLDFTGTHNYSNTTTYQASQNYVSSKDYGSLPTTAPTKSTVTTTERAPLTAPTPAPIVSKISPTLQPAIRKTPEQPNIANIQQEKAQPQIMIDTPSKHTAPPRTTAATQQATTKPPAEIAIPIQTKTAQNKTSARSKVVNLDERLAHNKQPITNASLKPSTEPHNKQKEPLMAPITKSEQSVQPKQTRPTTSNATPPSGQPPSNGVSPVNNESPSSDTPPPPASSGGGGGGGTPPPGGEPPDGGNKPPDQQQMRYLPQTDILEESNSRKLSIYIIMLISLIVLGLLIWSTQTTIIETATAFGEVVPSGQIQVMQHLEGGIIAKIFVKNGSRVKKDQLLMTLNPTSALSELERIQSREIALLLDAERLRAFVLEKDSNLESWSKRVIHSKFNRVKDAKDILDALRDQQLLLKLQIKAREDQRAVLFAQIAQRKEEMKQYGEQKTILQKHVKLLLEEQQMYEQLRKTNPISRRDYLAVQRQVNQAQGNLLKISSQAQQTIKALEEVQNRLKELNSSLHQTAIQKLSEVNAELLEIRRSINKLQDRVKRLKIIAPVRGIVKGLDVSLGSVIPAGGTLLEIVPLNQRLVVDARISTKDIGHVKIGDPVEIKITTYDFSRYGTLKGKLVSISASTFTNEENRPYYRGTISLEHEYIGDNPNKNQALPGMTVEADIQTGEKTLLQYLLKPIRASLQSSFRER